VTHRGATYRTWTDGVSRLTSERWSPRSLGDFTAPRQMRQSARRPCNVCRGHIEHAAALIVDLFNRECARKLQRRTSNPAEWAVYSVSVFSLY
jgi:hypothetical protein